MAKQVTLKVVDSKSHQQVFVVKEICLIEAVPQFQQHDRWVQYLFDDG